MNLSELNVEIRAAATMQEVGAQVKARYENFHGEIHASIESFWFCNPDAEPGWVWQEFGHTLVECGDADDMSQIIVIMGSHSEDCVMEPSGREVAFP